MRAVVLTCKPGARFHFGGIAPDESTWLSSSEEWMRSDTLFSAILNTAAEVCPPATVEAIVRAFEAGQVRISSGFYLLQGPNRSIFFLPKPAHYALIVNKDFDKFHTVKFISKGVWESGWPWEEWENNCWFLQNGAVVVAKEELPEITDAQAASTIRLWTQEDYPRVKVHAIDRKEGFFYLTTTNICDNTATLKDGRVHFYFLLDNDEGEDANEEVLNALEMAIRLLPHRGLGGERSAGCGQVEEVRLEPFTLRPTFTDSTWHCSVSLTSPTEQDLKIAKCYAVLLRGGRRYGGQNKRFAFVRMLAEGAVFEEQPSGQLPVIGVNLGHQVRRYGKPLCLPVRSFS